MQHVPSLHLVSSTSTTTALLLLLLFSLSPHPAAASTDNEADRQSAAFAFLAYPRVFDGLVVEGLETPVQFRALLYLNLATFNAWSNFHPTASDIFGRTKYKRPKREHTRKNKNIAVLYALLRLYESSPNSFGGPSGIPGFRKIFVEMDLDPDDTSMDTSTPVGIGNKEGMDTARIMTMDGWNSEGDLTGTHDNYLQHFADYTGYVPKNSPWKLTFPFRWQPLLENNGLGFFFRQEHVTPYAGSAIAFGLTPRDVKRRKVDSPYKKPQARSKSALKGDIKTLRRLAEKVLATSAGLTEKQRLIAELFDNKVNAFKTTENPLGVPSIGAAVRFFVLAPQLDWTLDDDIIYGLGANIATFDAMVAVWKEKVRQDAVRPTGQTMQYLLGDREFEVWGGPSSDNVRIKAGNWLPLIRTMPHSEFPSASACACSSLIEHALIVTEGRDRFPYNVTIPKGASKFYPGEVPKKDVTIPINTLTKWSQLCGNSRLWAGVHFTPAVKAGRDLCKGIGRSSQDLVDELLSGKPKNLKWMEWLPPGVEKFWEED